MATALAKGLLSAGITLPERLVAGDVHEEPRHRFIRETGGTAVESNVDVVAQSAIVFLAVKPQQMQSVLDELRNHVAAEHLVISIAAGVPLRTFTAVWGRNCRVVRVMPNTPCLVSAGASAFALGGAATLDDGVLVERLLSTVGLVFSLPESQLDAVTGLSGSGPAFVYQVIEALSDGGVRAGLPRDVSTRLAAQTVFGAAKMVLETGEHPGVLKDAVASPGGTTIAGLHELEQGGLRACLMNAVQSATLRSRELGQPS